jgi:hypothetical protein
MCLLWNYYIATVKLILLIKQIYFFTLGHSLGAGTGILLGMLIRPVYPDLRVYGFATPGLFIVNWSH